MLPCRPLSLVCFFAAYIYIYKYLSIVIYKKNLFPWHLFPHKIARHALAAFIAKENRKISWKTADVASFWKHWRDHIPIDHPAAGEGRHIPIGIFGDDAKYTLAGAKVIVMLLNIVIQTTMRFLAIVI